MSARHCYGCYRSGRADQRPVRRASPDEMVPVHDRGRVLVDLAVMIADGGEAIADIDVLRHQDEVFGRVASDTTVWRALDEIGAVQLRPIAKARAKVRARMWQLFR